MGYRPHVLTTAGDLVDAASNGVYQRLPAGPNGQFLQVAGGVPAWQQPATFAPAGLSGATAASRYVGATASGAPTTGTFAVGDFVVDQTGKAWVCTVAGTPGTWAQLAGGAGSSTLAADTDVAIASPVGGQVLGYSSALSKWVNQSQAGVAATTQTAQLGADVTLTATSTWYDGPSLTVPPGTWLLLSTATFIAPSAGSCDFTARLWDGTTTFSSDQATAATGYDVAISLSAVVSPTSTTTYKLSAAGNHAGALMVAAANNNTVGNNATKLTAIQLSGNPVGQQAPAVKASNSANISISNAATNYLTFDTTEYDRGTPVPQHSTGSSTSRLTCQQAGLYQIESQIELAQNGTGVREALVRLNGATVIGSDYRPASSVDSTIFRISVQRILAVGDYIEVGVYQSSGSALNVLATNSGPPMFMMARIDSGPGAVQPNTKVQLDASGVSTFSGTSQSAGSMHYVTSTLSFMVDDPNSVMEFEVYGQLAVQNSSSATTMDCNTYFNVDGVDIFSTDVVVSNPGWGGLGGQFGRYVKSGLSAGTHTVKLGINPGVAAVLWGGPLYIRVLERKQSVSPPSSTPAPAVRVKNSASQSVGTTMAALNFDTTELDQGTSSPQHSMSSNNSRLTCQQAGFYSILGTISWSGVISSEVDISVRLNGTTDIGYFQNAGGLYITIHQVSAMHYLNVGDYVEFYAVNNNALSATNYADASTTFAMVRCDTGGTGAVYVPQVKTSNYTCLPTDSMVVAGASGLTLTLPAASAYTGKPPLVIKNDPGFSASTIAAAGSDTIDGAATYALPSEKQSISLVSDAISKWRVM